MTKISDSPAGSPEAPRGTLQARECKMSRYRRHPAEVTSDRLGDAVERWHDQFGPDERDMVAKIRFRLEQIAEDADSDSANTGWAMNRSDADPGYWQAAAGKDGGR